jgi:hypothetical protein
MGEKPRQEDEQPIAPESKGLNFEHLAEGVSPIMACVGTYKEYAGEIAKIEDIEAFGHNADYTGHPDLLDKQDIKNAGYGTYAISPVDEKPKFTENLWNCTSIVAVGREKETGKEISILTHQDPSIFLKEKGKKLFFVDLEDRLGEFKEKCLKGTIDIVIAGGNLREKAPEEYEKSIEALSSTVEGLFGFKPTVIVGPKESGMDNIYLDTQNRRLYVVRPENSKLHNEVFKPDQIDEMKKKWKSKK